MEQFKTSQRSRETNSNTAGMLARISAIAVVSALTVSFVPSLLDTTSDAAWAAGQGSGGGGGGGGGDGGGGGGGDGGGDGGGGGGGDDRGSRSGSSNAGSGGATAGAVGGQKSAPTAKSSVSDDSDKPQWAGQPGGKDGAGGGQPATAGDMRGDLFGDMYVILRDSDGIPILTPEGWVQPLDANGNPIPLDAEGHPVDETLTVEVELGRLNVGRAPTSVLDRRTSEVVTVLSSATAISVDAAGRLVLTAPDGTVKTIDSPLENLAIYNALMTTGSIPGLTTADIVGTAFDFLADGVLTAADLAASPTFLAAATDKTGAFTTDEIAYINAFLGINTTTAGDVTYSQVDYSTFSYDRSDTFGTVVADVLVYDPNQDAWVQTQVNIFDTVFGSVDVSLSGSLDAYTTAADDARQVIEFVHEFAIPGT